MCDKINLPYYIGPPQLSFAKLDSYSKACVIQLMLFFIYILKYLTTLQISIKGLYSTIPVSRIKEKLKKKCFYK